MKFDQHTTPSPAIPTTAVFRISTAEAEVETALFHVITVNVTRTKAARVALMAITQIQFLLTA